MSDIKGHYCDFSFKWIMRLIIIKIPLKYKYIRLNNVILTENNCIIKSNSTMYCKVNIQKKNSVKLNIF